MKNKITFIMPSPGDGGSENVCINIVNGLADRGWHVDLVCVNLKRKESLANISDKVNLVNLNIKRFIFSFLPILKYLKSNKVKHIVCIHYIYAMQLVLQNFLLNNQLKIIARHNTSLSSEIKNNYNNFILKRVITKIIKFFYSKVDYSIAQCVDMKIDLVKNFNFDEKIIKVIYNPVSYKIEKNYNNKENKKENYILLVGRLSKEKRYDIAIRVFSKVRNKFPNLKLKISGKGKEEDYLRQLSKKYGVNEDVDFLGFQKDIVLLYQKAKLTLMTSSLEGFPNTLVESITLGTPVVSFNCPSGPREIIQNKINGFLVKVDDEIMLEQKIIEALKIKWNQHQIHNTAIRHRYEKIINEFENFFSQIISQSEKR